MEGVEGKVMETLDEQNEAENCRYAEARSKEPRRLTQGVHQKYADEYSDGGRKCDRIVTTFQC